MLSAHLITPDYELPTGGALNEEMHLRPIADTFRLVGPCAQVGIEDSGTAGKVGNQAAVCNCLMPIPFGSWQGDYVNHGFALPASYTTGECEIKCANESIDLVTFAGITISRTLMWNDQWTPRYQRGGSTRCGLATMMSDATLAAARKQLGRHLAWFATLRIWKRETEYGDFRESTRTTFVRD
jgi:hypothetical protein